MNMKSLFAAVLCLAASAAAAQNFEAQIAETVAAARRSVKTESPFAKVVDCDGNSEYYLSGPMRFYVRLDDKTSLDQIPADKWISVRADKVSPRDETRLDDYGGVSLNRSTYSIRQWSCDTQDYEFTIATPSLVRQGDEKTRKIAVHAHVETRGQTDYDGELSCTASWVVAPIPPRGRD
jgi:hypothetical protein